MPPLIDQVEDFDWLPWIEEKIIVKQAYSPMKLRNVSLIQITKHDVLKTKPINCTVDRRAVVIFSSSLLGKAK